jgi:ribosomal protein S19E (S16A)
MRVAAVIARIGVKAACTIGSISHAVGGRQSRPCMLLISGTLQRLDDVRRNAAGKERIDGEWRRDA